VTRDGGAPGGGGNPRARPFHFPRRHLSPTSPHKMTAGRHRLGPAVAMVFAVAGHVSGGSRAPAAPRGAGGESPGAAIRGRFTRSRLGRRKIRLERGDGGSSQVPPSSRRRTALRARRAAKASPGWSLSVATQNPSRHPRIRWGHATLAPQLFAAPLPAAVWAGSGGELGDEPRCGGLGLVRAADAGCCRPCLGASLSVCRSLNFPRGI